MNKKFDGMYLVAFILPLVGIIVGTIRCAKNEESGKMLLVASALFFGFWYAVTIILSAITASLGG